jgi:hypothetical protein
MLHFMIYSCFFHFSGKGDVLSQAEKMIDDSDTAREFQRRRKETWNGIKRWLFVPAAG